MQVIETYDFAAPADVDNFKLNLSDRSTMTQSAPGHPFALGTFRAADNAGRSFSGIVVGDDVIPLTGLEAFPAMLDRSVFELLQAWADVFPELQALAASDAPRVSLGSLALLAPLAPRQIICTGANYRKHVIELMVDQKIDSGESDGSEEERRVRVAKMMDDRIANGEPYAFPKLPSSVTGPRDPIVLGDASDVDWELELGVVIGRRARNVRRTEALDYVAGFTIINDITCRGLVMRADMKAIGTDWLRAKSQPTFAPLGPFIVPRQFVPDPANLRITLKLNGKVMQDESTADMIFDVSRQIEYISRYVQLEPGDVIATGSPAGNGTHWNRFLRPGDEIESSIEGLGQQRNRCVTAIQAPSLSHTQGV